MKLKTGGIALALVMGAAAPALAHHSAAMFDNQKKVTLANATVVELIWSNPHVYLEVDVKDDDGKVTPWSVEFPLGPAQMARTGWSKTTVKPGDKVTMTVHPLRDGRPGGDYVNIVLPDGKKLGRE